MPDSNISVSLPGLERDLNRLLGGFEALSLGSIPTVRLYQFGPAGGPGGDASLPPVEHNAWYCPCAGRRRTALVPDEPGESARNAPPLFDEFGEPIVGEGGERMTVSSPAFRTIQVLCDEKGPAKELHTLACRGGQVLAQFLFPIFEPIADEWDFIEEEELWWALLFEFAWADPRWRRRAPRAIWRSGEVNPLSAEQETADSPDSGEGQHVVNAAQSSGQEHVPDTFRSTLDDAPGACVHLCEALLAELTEAAKAPSRRSKDAGRPPEYDKSADEKLARDWLESPHTQYADFAKDRGISKEEVKGAVDRARHRKK